ncbi:hypothetical protein ACQKWADRAFT_207231 [Trichoderma austrokoningii]
MMKTICEVEENHHGGPDPPVPLLDVPSHDASPQHVTFLKHPLPVLETTEILENVFAHVDAVTLLTSVQRVSKTWKDVVDGSVLLQRKLFFVPDETHPLEPHPHTRLEKDSDSGKVYPVLNSLLVRHFRSSFFSLGTKFYGFTRRSESFYEQRWTSKHSTLKRKMGANAAYIKYKSVKPDITQVEALQVSLDRDRFTRAGASWRRMLVSQPPIPDLMAMEFGPTRIHDPDSPEKLRFDTLTAHDADKGLCMGQLYDFVQDRVSNHPLDCLWYRVVWFEPRAPFASDLNEDSCVMAFEDLGTRCVVEMFHREDKRLDLSSLSTFPPGFAVREGPLSSSRQIVSTSKHLHNPLDPGNFDAIFKCDEFEPADWSPAHEATDYYLVARRTLFQLED